MKPALIHNPNSRKNKNNESNFISLAEKKLGEFFICSPDSKDLLDNIRKLKNKDVNLIAINGGDGTVSTCLTAISTIYPHDKLPFIAVLSSGNTNLIASDIGFGIRGEKAVERLISREEFHYRERSPICLSWLGGGRETVMGMFGGCTGYARAIHIAHSPAVNRFAPHDLAVFYTVLISIIGLIFPKRRRVWMSGDYCENNILPLGSSDTLKRNKSFLFLVTSLEKLTYGIWPFWNNEDQKKGFHYLDVRAFPKKLPLAIINLLRGYAPSWLKKHSDYRSGKTSEIILKTDSDFVLDGEVFPALVDQRILLKRGPVFRFLHV